MQKITGFMQKDPENPLFVFEHGSAGVYTIEYPHHLEVGGSAGFLAGYFGMGPRSLALALTRRVFGEAQITPDRKQAILENLVSRLPKDQSWTIAKADVRDAAEGKKLREFQRGLPMFL